MRRIAALWGPLVAYMAVLLWASTRTSLPGADVVGDKFLHAGAYALLALLALRALQGGPGPVRHGAALGAVVLACVYGVLDESVQSLVPGRDASGWDLAANGVGATLAVLGLAGLRGLQRGNRTAAEQAR